ncbi:MAG: CRTAC1 family protein [Verrucomicrobiales bacterium]|nr:CRTAC1 family protein [Verrucomicrobiales bacterium]
MPFHSLIPKSLQQTSFYPTVCEQMATSSLKPIHYVLAAIAAGAALVATLVWWRRTPPGPGQSIQLSQQQIQTLASNLGSLQKQEANLNETVWKKELVAQQCGHILEELWDALNAATNKLALAAAVPLRELLLPKLAGAEKFSHGVSRYASSGPGLKLNNAAWQAFLSEKQREGWELAQAEFRHNQFELDEQGQPRRSRFYFSAHLWNSHQTNRAILEGDLVVHWEIVAGTGQPAVQSIDASTISVKARAGDPIFQLLLSAEIAPFEGTQFIDPLILYDLDGDGYSEIILAGRNLVLRRGADGGFHSEPLCRHAPGLTFTGTLADFDGDGRVDFLCAKFEGLSLFKGSLAGTFDDPGVLVWPANPRLKYAQVLPCGDIDSDGDLDVWLAQYKVPYERGQMPTPYFDANDGHASYLLLNDGHGHFTDATEASGLAKKRSRRCYSASFADLDGDRDLDMVTVSDFAGLDLYRNDGRGHFTDVTAQWAEEPHAFGMAHALADFDGDAQLDLLMIGMNSPTAERLEHLALKRPGFEQSDAMRARMIYGNRLYLGQPNGPGFTRSKLNESIARTGWSWGCSGLDFDNDGLADVYIANGHVSRQSVRDHEPEFWLHDIYVANSRDNLVAFAYMADKFNASRDQGRSYGGYEKNRFFWNQRGASFLEIGHLLGVSLEADSRNVVADDIDGDGRMDLLVTTMEVWPALQQSVRVFRNELADSGNWIGFRFREEGNGCSPVGARVTVRHAGGTAVRQIVTGDSYRSQSANTAHFGLGAITEVHQAEIRWANGRTVILDRPGVNQYHAVASGQPPRMPSPR